MAITRKFGVFEIDEGGGQVTLKSGNTLSADQVTEGTNKFVTAAQKTNLDNIVDAGRKNLWTDGALKYWLEQITVTDPATSVYGSTLIQVKHLKASGTRGTMTIAQQALTPGVSPADYALRVSASGADSSLDADSYYLIRHYIYHGIRNHSNGEKITISFKVESSVADQKIGVVLRQNYGTTGSPSSEEILTGEIFTLASGVNSISKTFTTNSLTEKTFGTDNNDCLIIDIVVQCGSTVATALFEGSAFGFTEAVNLDFYELAAYQGEVVYDFVVSDDFFDVDRQYRKITRPICFYNVYAANALYFVNLYNNMIKTPTPSFFGTADNVTNGYFVYNYNGGTQLAGFTYTLSAGLTGIQITATKTAHGYTYNIGLTFAGASGIILDARY
jgi:hypothetical protein